MTWGQYVDIRQEINKHLAWIETVASLFEHEKISPEAQQELAQHDRCDLGQWLQSDESDRWKDLPEMEQLKKDHEAFHKTAGELIAVLEDGDETRAITLQERLLQKSQKVISYLQLLEEKEQAAKEEK